MKIKIIPPEKFPAAPEYYFGFTKEEIKEMSSEVFSIMTKCEKFDEFFKAVVRSYEDEDDNTLLMACHLAIDIVKYLVNEGGKDA